MSEMPPDPAQQQGNFLTRKYGGIPGIVWIGGVAIIAYFLFFRNSSSSGNSSSGGGGQSTTGDITLQPGTETIDLSGQTSGTTGVDNPAPVTDNNGVPENPGGPNQTGTPNPQPTPVPPPKKKVIGKKVTHKAGAAPTVTVAQWPGSAVGGIAQWNTTLWGIANHYHTSVSELLKLNPWIKNPNQLQPGWKIKVP